MNGHYRIEHIRTDDFYKNIIKMHPANANYTKGKAILHQQYGRIRDFLIKIRRFQFILLIISSVAETGPNFLARAGASLLILHLTFSFTALNQVFKFQG